ncbi:MULTISPECIES: hypothetical protein [Rhizobium/Agrobacterium group]|uniref:Two component regulator propeller n=3 Tax=Rhizobiaceae TaxID=82115 RepID=B9K4I8_ALLAM|nr:MULTISPECIES: hypothetical protein [Rhizobium/Agrobacterium group]ACM39786.1 hypothetical protein Avi_7053 [Allorhizobium ampelinum S4]MCF1450807.1 hypothetical protein [Allorhizobium ampelinum]MUO31541.1 hypothetical protein [Agrobacterium vitis]MUO45336.1 hypothetical protein [Agrobacterium vitis]MUP13230.1 hypothetical protein [Agrobacterium vitis]
MPKKQVSFTRLCAVNKDIVYIGTTPDDQEMATPFTAICQYDAGEWSYETFDFPLASLTLYREPGSSQRVLYVLGEAGTAVNFHTKTREIIVDLLNAPRRKHRLGYLQSIRQVGDHLYVCGDGGQTYRRSSDGQWQALDLGFFDGPDAIMDPKSELRLMSSLTRIKENRTEENYAKLKILREENQSKTLWNLSGLSEDSIYFAGEKKTVYWFDGEKITEIPTEADRGLLSILVENEDRVWVAGRDGNFLVGNHKTGFRDLDALRGIDGWPSFNGMTMFNGRLYLSSYADPRGLFVFDGHHVEQVRSGLTPDIDDVSAVEAIDGVLWVMGRKDLLRYDGTHWERIDFPGNDPLR